MCVYMCVCVCVCVCFCVYVCTCVCVCVCVSVCVSVHAHLRVCLGGTGCMPLLYGCAPALVHAGVVCVCLCYVQA